jgi:hypothetical protein
LGKETLPPPFFDYARAKLPTITLPEYGSFLLEECKNLRDLILGVLYNKKCILYKKEDVVTLVRTDWIIYVDVH